MTLGVWIVKTTEMLQRSGITTPRLDALVLLADELEKDKSWILAHLEDSLQIEQFEKLSTKIVQREKHIPLAYIRGHAEFYGQEFIVNEHVLVPRPESESIIELLKGLPLHDRKLAIIDVGTGSGCLAITAKLELPNAEIYALDIDEDCLDVAKRNAARLRVDIETLRSDILGSLASSVFDFQSLVILANLPYVPEEFPINEAATHEPDIALFSGEDGLDHYRQLFAQAEKLEIMPEAIITESLATQHEGLAHIARQHGFVYRSTIGLAQLFTSK